MDYTNWLKLRRRSLLYDYFCYFDTEARLADNLFEQNGMNVSFLQEFKNANRPFIAVISIMRRFVSSSTRCVGRPGRKEKSLCRENKKYGDISSW